MANLIDIEDLIQAIIDRYEDNNYYNIAKLHEIKEEIINSYVKSNSYKKNRRIIEEYFQKDILECVISLDRTIISKIEICEIICKELLLERINLENSFFEFLIRHRTMGRDCD